MVTIQCRACGQLVQVRAADVMRIPLHHPKEHDGRVLALLASAGPLSKRDIADGLDLDPSAVFMSLFRLNRDGRVTRAGKKKWATPR